MQPKLKTLLLLPQFKIIAVILLFRWLLFIFFDLIEAISHQILIEPLGIQKKCDVAAALIRYIVAKRFHCDLNRVDVVLIIKY